MMKMESKSKIEMNENLDKLRIFLAKKGEATVVVQAAIGKSIVRTETSTWDIVFYDDSVEVCNNNTSFEFDIDEKAYCKEEDDMFVVIFLNEDIITFEFM